MGLLKELFGKKGTLKNPITFEETKKYNYKDYSIEPIQIKGKTMYYVQPIPKKTRRTTAINKNTKRKL